MPKTIKIFLIEGEPDGLRTAELSNWIGKALVIPKNKLKAVKDREDCNKPSVYFLIGKENEDDLLSTVYIGEAEVLWERLKAHSNSKQFWQIAVAFISKDDSLTKAHVKYLESKSIDLAGQAMRYKLDNETNSSLPSLSESEIADIEEFLLNLKLLLTAVSYPILQDLINKEEIDSSNPLLYCSGKGASATGRLANNGFIVYKDSTANGSLAYSVRDKNKRVIEKLVKNGYLEKRDGDLYVFLKEYVFNTPSGASDIVLGCSSSGFERWKTGSGVALKNLNEINEN